MITGVTAGYAKKLEISGVGYRVAAKGSDLEFALGYSHPIPVEAPEGITFEVESPDQVLGRGHRQAEGRRGRRQHPQAAQARPVQGQGRQVRGRESSAARSERRVSKPGIRVKIAQGRGYKRAPQARATSASARRSPARAVRPRLVVTRSTRHIVAQVIDDVKGHTLASASTLEADPRVAEGDKTARGKKVGELVAERAKAAGVDAVVFDRGGNRTTAASPPWPTPPAKPGWSSDASTRRNGAA